LYVIGKYLESNKKGGVKMRRNFYKKKAFTLIELIAVMAIIGVLAAALVPKVSKYMTEAKKVKAVAQARTAVAAADMYNAKNDIQADETKTISEFPGSIVPAAATAEGAEFKKDTSVIQKLSLGQCRQIVNDGKDFTIGTDGQAAPVTAN